MGRLTTHVLNTVNGRPGAGMAVDLYAVEGESRRLLKSVTTNDDGRCDAPLLEGDDLTVGTYELVFKAGDFFRATGEAAGEGVIFLDEVPIRFGVPDPGEHYHVPLLVTPFSYSTYRGS